MENQRELQSAYLRSRSTFRPYYKEKTFLSLLPPDLQYSLDKINTNCNYSIEVNTQIILENDRSRADITIPDHSGLKTEIGHLIKSIVARENYRIEIGNTVLIYDGNADSINVIYTYAYLDEEPEHIGPFEVCIRLLETLFNAYNKIID